ncbi:hypothetical protein CaCOL14_005369 [Colletotrichum acutatum]
MAATGQAFRLCVRSSRRIPSTPRIAAARTTTTATTTQRRAFTASTTQQARREREEIYEDPYDRKRETVEELVARLKPEEVKKLQKLQKQDPEFQSMSVAEALEARMAKQGRLPPLKPTRTPRQNVQRNSFWYDDDDPTAPIDPALEEFEEDDITPMAHGKLDEIREYRHYHRIMAWEMPLLSSTLQFPRLYSSLQLSRSPPFAPSPLEQNERCADYRSKQSSPSLSSRLRRTRCCASGTLRTWASTTRRRRRWSCSSRRPTWDSPTRRRTSSASLSGRGTTPRRTWSR